MRTEGLAELARGRWCRRPGQGGQLSPPLGFHPHPQGPLGPRETLAPLEVLSLKHEREEQTRWWLSCASLPMTPEVGREFLLQMKKQIWQGHAPAQDPWAWHQGPRLTLPRPGGLGGALPSAPPITRFRGCVSP